MPTLFEAPDPSTLTLIRTIAQGREKAGIWPVWQWVSRQLADQGLDSDEVLRGAPTWQHYYRSVVPENGANSIPDPGHRLRLTVHGLVHGQTATTDRLLQQFLEAVRIGVEKQTTSPVEPGQLRKVIIDGPELAKAVEARVGGTCDIAALGTMLRHEPSTWSGLIGDTASNSWSWDLTARSLRPFAQAHSPKAYLVALDGLVGTRQQPTASDIYMPASALPDAIDFLEVTWRLATGDKLFRFRRASTLARLVMECASADEFQSRCSALADVLNDIDVPGEGPSLQRLRDHLTLTLKADALKQATGAVEVLRQIVALRAGQQHSGAGVRAAKAARELRLTLNGDWNMAWLSVRSIAVAALSNLREAVTSTLPE